MCVVNLFVHWLYTQQIPTEPSAMKSIVRRPDDPRGYMDMGLVLVKAYTLGDRILASTFRRQANNTLIGLRLNFGTPRSLLQTIVYASANIPNDRNILQFLTNKLCGSYYPDNNEETDALSELPPTFSVRVIRRLAYLRHGYLGGAHPYDGCYIEHATDEEQKSCKKLHLKFSGGENGYGHFV
jgi:hypothetical protein